MTPKDRKILLCRIEEKIYTAVKRIDQFSGPFNAEEVAVEILDFFENPMIMAKLITPVQDIPSPPNIVTRTYEITFDEPCEGWLCADNLSLALHAYCRNTKFTVVEIVAQPKKVCEVTEAYKKGD